MSTERPTIDPALGLDLAAERTLASDVEFVSVIIPAHNEQDTIQQVVKDCQQGLSVLNIAGEVLVSASGCTDATAELAASAGARVIESPIGKGAALTAGLSATTGDVVCLVDGDIQYFGNPPLVTILVDPIIRGVADATIADLYWRPLYPQMWLYAFFTPLASHLFPELLTKAGSTPWSGQRAARRPLWPTELRNDFTVDLQILLEWNSNALRLHPIVTDDWVNPQRPKADLMRSELDLAVSHARSEGRLTQESEAALTTWYEAAHALMAGYRPEHDDPQVFERQLLRDSLRELRQALRPT